MHPWSQISASLGAGPSLVSATGGDSRWLSTSQDWGLELDGDLNEELVGTGATIGKQAARSTLMIKSCTTP